jgi:subtilase family serine protease
MRNRRRFRRALPACDPLEDRCLLTGYTPAQITGAYGLNAITFTSPSGTTVKGDGSGQTIALIEEYHDPYIQSDLKAFDRTYGLPDPSLTVVDQAGKQTDSSWAAEEAMDVEYAHAIAPGARILVVEARPSGNQIIELQNQLDAVNTARHTQGVVAISMSWGYNEMSNESSYDSYFTTPSGHTGITFIASSGDLGFAEYPASSPNVLSVGGTSLWLNASGSYQSETAWFLSGGSYSSYEPEPSYQMSVQTTGYRATPDVAFDAASSTGVVVYETAPRTGRGSWQISAGTSLGAPAWAAIIAIVDQGRALAGKGSLDGPSQTLPALYALPSSDFHGVMPFTPVGGLSSLLWFILGSDSSGANANIETGLGSPNGRSLVDDLAATPSTYAGIPNGSGGSPTGAIPPTKVDRGRLKHHHKVRHGHRTGQTKAHASGMSPRRVVAQGSPTGTLGSPHSGWY